MLINLLSYNRMCDLARAIAFGFESYQATSDTKKLTGDGVFRNYSLTTDN